MEKYNDIESLTEDPLKRVKQSVDITQKVHKRINRIVSEIKDNLKAEREGNPINVNKLKAEIRKKQQQLTLIQRDIQKLKQRSIKHKTNIDQWKQVYEDLPYENKEAEKEKLIREFNRRAVQIKKLEKKIGRLLPFEIAIKQDIDILKIKVGVFEQQIFEGSLDQDPRLLNLLQQQKNANSLLKSARAELKSLKKEMGVRS